jgi:enediyne biosynthesis protein E4
VICKQRRQVVFLCRCLLAAASLSLLLVGTAAVRVAPREARSQPPAPAGPLFREQARESGLDFVHFNGMSGEMYFSEIVGPGAALFDYDNDGDLDLYVVQGAMLGPGKSFADALFPPQMPLPLTDRLYRNDLTVAADGSRTLRFTDVTEHSGILAPEYGMGVAAADFDNDGWTDLYVTGFGPNRMWRNNGDGTFSDVTERTGTGDRRWSSSAAFLDFDRDGWLDLYVANYVDFGIASHKRCRAPTGRAEYCGPQSYKGEPDRLFRNRGDGTFEDVSGPSGILAAYGSALGVSTADFDGDGWPDVYVANDGEANFLWLNQRDGTFRDEALLAGCAVNRDGTPEASMGVDAADVDNDGDEDLFMTHLLFETNTLYLNEGKGVFEDRSAGSGLGPPSRGYTGFGTAFLDFDNDGWLDVFVANGSVSLLEHLLRAADPFPLHQKNQLYRNLGGTSFAEVSEQGGGGFDLSEVSRGVAVGDIDNDGDSDVLVLNNNGPARLFLNQAGQDRRWLGLRLAGTAGRRDMLGTRVAILLRDGRTLWRRARSDGSYLSASDPRVLVGLGERGAVQRVRVYWPGGSVEEWDVDELGRYLTLVEGTGRTVPGA